MMKTLALVCSLGLLVVAGSGCGGDDLVKQAKALKDKVCACKDVECVNKLEKEFDSFGEKLEAKYKDEKDAPKELRDAFNDIESCMDKMGEAAPEPELTPAK